jgi:hypothetical protein
MNDNKLNQTQNQIRNHIHQSILILLWNPAQSGLAQFGE